MARRQAVLLERCCPGVATQNWTNARGIKAGRARSHAEGRKEAQPCSAISLGPKRGMVTGQREPDRKRYCLASPVRPAEG